MEELNKGSNSREEEKAENKNLLDKENNNV